MGSIVPISSERPAHKTLLPLSSFSFAKKQNLIPIVASEFAQIAREFPIVFVENKETLGVFALCGLKNEVNLFIDKDERWSAEYIPATLRRYPFIFAKGKDEKEYVLCIDESSGLLAEKGGTPLFNEAGEKEPALDKALKFVSAYQQAALQSENLCAFVKKHNLLKPLNIELKGQDDKSVKIGGLLTVDEKKLNELADDVFLQLRKTGGVALIYAQLLSLGNLSALVKRMATKNAMPAGSDNSVPDRFSF
jgi:hypothetical protein